MEDGKISPEFGIEHKITGGQIKVSFKSVKAL
jgi:hypothetical protein